MGASHLFALEVACTEGVQAYLTGFPDVTILRSASSWALTRRSAVERRAQPPRTVAVSDSSEEALAVQRSTRGMKRSIVGLAPVAPQLNAQRGTPPRHSASADTATPARPPSTEYHRTNRSLASRLPR